MSAPEKIWAWCFNTGEFGGWGSWGGYARPDNRHPMDDKERETGAEFVRADVHEAALTEARAETAAVIEAAIYEVNAMADFSCGCDPVHCRCYRDREAYHLAAEHLSDTLKAPAHATAALDEIKRQAREEAIREWLREELKYLEARRDMLADAEKRQIDVGLSGRDYQPRRLEVELATRRILALLDQASERAPLDREETSAFDRALERTHPLIDQAPEER